MAPSKSVLVINSGSSSLKYALFDLGKTAKCIYQGLVGGIGTSKSFISHRNVPALLDIKLQAADCTDHKQGLKRVLELLNFGKGHSGIAAVGHRVVHGGETLTEPTIITDSVKRAIEKAIPLAPLHNPPNLQGIRDAEEIFDCPQVAVFDTAFHGTMPPKAYMYAIPFQFYKELGIRRYGFHGTSYEYLLGQTENVLNKPKDDLNLIIFHLGAGASMAAIKQGKSIDTTMGLTPLPGLVMATRSGDIDPAIWQMLATEKGLSNEEISTMLNKESGMFGLCGEKDMRAVWDAVEQGSKQHTLALDVFIHRIRTYLGAYLVHLQGQVDALVFSAGIGEASAQTRTCICEGLEGFGIEIDAGKNIDSKSKKPMQIHKESSKIKILVIQTDEELHIAQQTLQVINSHHQTTSRGA